MNIQLERSSLLREGTYKVRIDSAEATMGPSGYPNVKLQFTVIDSNGRPTDRNLRSNLSFSPKARFRVDNFLDAIGAPSTGNMSLHELKGKTVYAVVGKSNYQGATRNEITAYMSEEQARTTKVQDVEASSGQGWDGEVEQDSLAGWGANGDDEDAPSGSYTPTDSVPDDDGSEDEDIPF